jgi:hypothetical protein
MADQAGLDRREPNLINQWVRSKDDQEVDGISDGALVAGATFLRFAGARFAVFLPTAFLAALRGAAFLALAFFTAPLRVAFLATTLRAAFFAGAFLAAFFADDFFAAAFFAGFLAAAFAIGIDPLSRSRHAAYA